MPKKAFTMVELLVVMTIIGLIAAFGTPSFLKAIARAKSRDALNNMTVIHAAQQLYKVNNTNYLAAANLAAINNGTSGLGLNLISRDNTAYACTTANCTATPTDSAFGVTAVLASAISSTNPLCTGECP